MEDNIFTYLSIGEILNKIYDITRIVDPMQKRAVDYQGGSVNIKDLHCYDFWGKN